MVPDISIHGTDFICPTKLGKQHPQYTSCMTRHFLTLGCQPAPACHPGWWQVRPGSCSHESQQH